ncbi:transmembrane protein 234 homolog [Venturia canescens]|uniref:transmembrane protein 234 homolog n=1 Tax=Venturia canescens TaxID=32260 RepID=UPI001C9BC729|nr:transmembrane protein 234 homolog [Venturia canescens]
MASVLEIIAYLVIVAILWGVTNPLLKKGATGIDDVKASSTSGKFLREVYFLVTNLKYMIPFLVNQCGSLLYVMTLQSADLSLAVPVTNSLTFVVTAMAGWIFGEEKPHKNVYIGILMIIAGTTICCLDKLNNENSIVTAY